MNHFCLLLLLTVVLVVEVHSHPGLRHEMIRLDFDEDRPENHENLHRKCPRRFCRHHRHNNRNKIPVDSGDKTGQSTEKAQTDNPATILDLAPTETPAVSQGPNENSNIES